MGVGLVDGIAVGIAVRITVGSAVGIGVGSTDGIAVGSADGIEVGLADGSAVNVGFGAGIAVVGVAVGCVVGAVDAVKQIADSFNIPFPVVTQALSVGSNPMPSAPHANAAKGESHWQCTATVSCGHESACPSLLAYPPVTIEYCRGSAPVCCTQLATARTSPLPFASEAVHTAVLVTNVPAAYGPAGAEPRYSAIHLCATIPAGHVATDVASSPVTVGSLVSHGPATFNVCRDPDGPLPLPLPVLPGFERCRRI